MYFAWMQNYDERNIQLVISCWFLFKLILKETVHILKIQSKSIEFINVILYCPTYFTLSATGLSTQRWSNWRFPRFCQLHIVNAYVACDEVDVSVVFHFLFFISCFFSSSMCLHKINGKKILLKTSILFKKKRVNRLETIQNNLQQCFKIS